MLLADDMSACYIGVHVQALRQTPSFIYITQNPALTTLTGAFLQLTSLGGAVVISQNALYTIDQTAFPSLSSVAGNLDISLNTGLVLMAFAFQARPKHHLARRCVACTHTCWVSERCGAGCASAACLLRAQHALLLAVRGC